MDKKSIIIGIFAGILLGIILSIFLASIITQPESPINQTAKANTEIDNLLYNGIYGWFCYDDSSYDPAISDLTQSYLDRGCKLISIDNSSVNRSYYLENGWD